MKCLFGEVSVWKNVCLEKYHFGEMALVKWILTMKMGFGKTYIQIPKYFMGEFSNGFLVFVQEYCIFKMENFAI